MASTHSRCLWIFGLLSLSACPTNPPATDGGADLSMPIDMAVDMAVDPSVDMAPTRGTRDTIFDSRLKKDLDVLFVIDNSTSMTAKQNQLVSALGSFWSRIDATGTNYHIGIATTDIGTLPPPGNMFPGVNDPRCGTYKGDDGLLQNLSCRLRTVNVSAEFVSACNTLCPSGTMVPTQRWLGKDNGVYNVADPAAALRCMSLVGDSGCGVESPLEAAKRALDGHLTENSGFLRAGSVLAVIFLTDEDDCSVQMTQRTNLNPMSMDCGTSPADPNYACYNLDYRCIAKDLQCNEPLNTVGAKTGCSERSTTFLEPVQRYATFFSALRSADKLVFGGIWSPSILDFNAGRTTPFGNGQLVTAYEFGSMSNTLNRGRLTQAACYNPDGSLTTDPKGYFGQAQIRLSSFKNSFDPNLWSEQSICDAAAYPNVLNSITAKIGSAVGTYCLAVKPDVDLSGAPACEVGFVDASQPGTLAPPYLPQCSATCCNAWANSAQPVGPYGAGTPPAITKDPAIVSACTPEPNDCYCAPPSNKGLCPKTAIAGLWRVGDAAPPAGKVANFRCTGTFPSN